MGGVGDRAGEIQRERTLLGHEHGGDGDVVLAGCHARENAWPGQDFLADFERCVFAQGIDHLVVEAGGLAVLHELEGTEVVFGDDDHVAALLYLGEVGGVCRAQGGREHGQQDQGGEHTAAVGEA